MARVARTSGPSMGPLHVQLYTERLPTLLRCSGHQETSGSNAAASALKSGGIAGTLLDVAMISCDQKRGGTVSHFVNHPIAPRAYLAAAQAEAAGYRYELARRLVERGLELAVEAADRSALARFQGDILHDLGDMTAAGLAYRSALSATGPGPERCRALIGLAAVKRVADDLTGAFADLESAEKEAVEQELITERARIHYVRGNLFFPRGDIEGCLLEHELSRKLAQQARSAEREAAALGGLGDAEYARGRMASANQHFRKCVELCREHGLGRIEVANLSMVPATRIYLNELRPPRSLLAELQHDVSCKVVGGIPNIGTLKRSNIAWPTSCVVSQKNCPIAASLGVSP